VYVNTKIEEKNNSPVKAKSGLERSNFKREFKRVKREGSTTSNFVILSTDQYLTHYWPFENGTMRDAIGSADMTQGSSTSFVADRYGNVNSALALNGGWTQVPAGVYFDSIEFTITVWVYPSNVGFHSRIIDFGNGPSADNIIVSLSYEYTLQPNFFFILSGSNYFSQTSSQPITFNQWQFLTATYNQKNARIYLNGTLVANSNTQNHTRLFYLSRSNCYIGKSHWPHDGNSSSYLDDLRFYNKSLTQEEIIELMNHSKSKINLFSQITFYSKLNINIISI
jgi:hypothetical protein